MEKISLKYFDCRGRAQAIRYFLAEKDILFRDIRLPLDSVGDSWSETKNDSSISGFLGKLPVLEWNDQQFCETMVIAYHLHEKFDAYKFSAKENLHMKSIISSVYTDIIVPMGTLIWLDILIPKASTKEYLARTLPTMDGLFERYDRSLSSLTARYLGQTQPSVADYFLFEGLHIFLKVFKSREKYYRTRHPILMKFYDSLLEDKAVINCFKSLPEQITGRPNEELRLVDIHNALQKS